MGLIAMTCPHAIHHLTVVLNGWGGTPDKRSICADGYEDRKWTEKPTPLSVCADVNENSKWAEKR